MSRFYLPPHAWDSARLDHDESHHLTSVMRIEAGETITVFDGLGRHACATVGATIHKCVSLDIALATRDSLPACPITLAPAVLKGKAFDLLIQKAVELGAYTIAPIITDRTIARFDDAEATRKCEKWRTAAIEACKQCGRNYLPRILPPISLSKWYGNEYKLGGAPALQAAHLDLVASLAPEARSLKSLLTEWHATHSTSPSSVTIFIGPEGDFTPAELALLASHSALPLSLGFATLRSETAALCALAIINHELQNPN